MAPVDASRGTPLWYFNRFGSYALTKLLDDLVEAEETGLKSDQGLQVHIALGKITNLLTEIPDGGILKISMSGQFQKFLDIFKAWCEIEGMDDNAQKNRAKVLRKLRKCRNRISTKARKNQFKLENELDLKLTDAMYQALGDSARALPEIFKNLAKVLNQYDKIKNGKFDLS